MTEREQGAGNESRPTTPTKDPIAELDEILADILANPKPIFTVAELEAMDRAQIGYEESIYPFLF